MITTRALRLTAIALFTGLLAGCNGSDGAANAQSRPGRLVELPDGRKLNLRCSGHGSPTVLLESGFGASSSAWNKVQPQVAALTRVCAYDRAGYGYSDPGALPRDGAAIVRDLDQALTAAEIEGPYIVMGHSAGGLYARLFAARRPGEVQGLILLDPTVERRAPSPSQDGLSGMRGRLQRCLAAAEAKPQPPSGAPQWDGCVSPTADAHAKAQALTPDVWRTQLSELDEIFGRTSEQVMRLGSVIQDVPAYVITASDTAASSPRLGEGDLPSVWELQHMRLAMSFRHGAQQTVLSSHLVMIDRPDVAAAAAEAMIKAARAGVSPDGLPPSETAKPSGDDPFGSAFPQEIQPKG